MRTKPDACRIASPEGGQVGVDFEDATAVAAYDRNQGTSAAEDEALLESLGVAAGAEGWVGRMVREEHSTFAWIIEGLLERTGFRIVMASKDDPAYADYLCVKQTVP
jgi:hypothetical protein